MKIPSLVSSCISLVMGFVILAMSFSLFFTPIFSYESDTIYIRQPNRSILACVFAVYSVYRLTRAWIFFSQHRREKNFSGNEND